MENMGANRQLMEKIMAVENMSNTHIEPITVPVATALNLAGIGRTKLYALLGEKRIKSIKVGKKRLIDVASLRQFLSEGSAA